MLYQLDCQAAVLRGRAYGHRSASWRHVCRRAVSVGNQTHFLEGGLIHQTERGELVRSKSEVIIADKLFGRGVDYAYEQSLVMSKGQQRYPDFTIADHARGVTYLWEHLGLMADPAYRSRWERKPAEYRTAGILPLSEGDGEHGTLIVTQDEPNGGMNSLQIGQLIDELFG
jgi:hypothetical protein